MTQQRALQAMLAQPWAITPEFFELMAEIAVREHDYAGDLKALEAKLGRPLGNTMSVSVRNGIASIPVEGALFKRASFFQAMSGATDYASIATDLQTALDDPQVRAVMLMIDSPGGAVAGVAELAALIRGADKPVWAYIEGTGASAAYWLASAADKIIAAPTAIIGSLGVMGGVTVRDPKAGEKAYTFISSQSPLKNADPGTDAGAQQFQQMVDDQARVFVASVAENRGVSIETVLAEFGQGGVFVAQRALDAKMVDNISTYEQALVTLQKDLHAMDYASLTVAGLRENRADLVASITAEAVASVEKVDVPKVQAEAVTAERARVTAIAALAMPGAEEVIAKCQADGTDANTAAVLVLKHVREKGTSAASAALAGIEGAEASMKPPKSTASAEGADPTDAAGDIVALARKMGVAR